MVSVFESGGGLKPVPQLNELKKLNELTEINERRELYLFRGTFLNEVPMDAPTKPYQLIFTVHPEYIYANLTSATISAQIIRDYIGEIVARCDATGRQRILLYRDIPAVLPGYEVFHTVNESIGALTGKKLALVNPHAAIEPEVGFAMTVGQNRGGNYRSFNNVADAEAWLLKDIK